MTRIRKKEGFIRTPPNRYGPGSSLSLNLLGVDVHVLESMKSMENAIHGCNCPRADDKEISWLSTGACLRL